MSRKYFLIVGSLTPSVIRAINYILEHKLWSELEVIVLARNIDYSSRIINKYRPEFNLQIYKCNFSLGELKEILRPFKDQIVGISCRSDKHVQDLRKVVPLLPDSVYSATEQSLTIATNKRMMREAFQKHAPQITPRHIQVNDDNHQTIKQVEDQLGYPVIVKPVNLASSLLIQSCQNRTELEHALNKVLSLIYGVYEQEDRYDSPEIIVEEYLEGDFYSIDAYALKSDDIFFCPPVSYIPAKQLGIDDFFLFKRSMPTMLSDSEIKAANEVTKQAILSVGLQYSSAHVELVLTNNGWRVIELGPRLGRFRNRMYNLVYGIDHSLNDIKVHLGLKPSINTKPIQYCAAYSIYPHHEGRITSIKGLEVLKDNPAVKWHKVFATPKQEAVFAKHGGHSLAELIVASVDKDSFTKLTKEIEKQIYAEIV